MTALLWWGLGSLAAFVLANVIMLYGAAQVPLATYKVWASADDKAKDRHVVAKVCRMPWIFALWWPSVNVVFFDCVYRNESWRMNCPTFRHELTHVVQYVLWGLLWILRHPIVREQQAHANEHPEIADQGTVFPQWVLLSGSELP